MPMNRRQFVAGAALAGAASALPLRAALPGSETSVPTLRAAGASRGILAGCAAPAKQLRANPAYAELVRSQAGILVAENDFKFGSLRPSPTTFFFENADFIADFAEQNQMKLRGHNFVWHRQIPDWFQGYVTPANAEAVLVNHIETVGGRYKGRIHSWDVVNEAIQLKDNLPGGMRASPWQTLLPGYIDIAFRTARRVDPKALLVYNEYGIESEAAGDEAKRKAVLGLLRGMQQRGVPVDGLGIQSHIGAGRDHHYGAGVQKLIAEAQAMGLKVLLTEMDVNDHDLPAATAERDAAVAEAYGSYLKLTLANPAVMAVLTWGITDKYTWLNGEDNRKDGLHERCLPFDEELKPKAAFLAEWKALGEAPRRSLG